ncbi:MAG: hypothetical protein RLZZ597_941, partial [Cyanobacteriota bacterium]
MIRVSVCWWILRQFKFEVQQRLIYPRRILQRVFCSQVIFSFLFSREHPTYGVSI